MLTNSRALIVWDVGIHSQQHVYKTKVDRGWKQNAVVLILRKWLHREWYPQISPTRISTLRKPLFSWL